MTDGIDPGALKKLLRYLPEKALNFLYERYYHRLLKISENFTHDRQASEDLVHDAFVLVYEKRKMLSKSDKNIVYFMAAVVRNRSVSYYLRHVKHFEDVEKFLYQNTSRTAESADMTFIRSEIAQALRNYVTTFPLRERQCLLMKVDNGMSPDQIARKLSVTRKAVERSLTCARRRLRAYWEDLERA